MKNSQRRFPAAWALTQSLGMVTLLALLFFLPGHVQTPEAKPVTVDAARAAEVRPGHNPPESGASGSGSSSRTAVVGV